jgi:hypothetical protein
MDFERQLRTVRCAGALFRFGQELGSNTSIPVTRQDRQVVNVEKWLAGECRKQPVADCPPGPRA